MFYLTHYRLLGHSLVVNLVEEEEQIVSSQILVMQYRQAQDQVVEKLEDRNHQEKQVELKAELDKVAQYLDQ